jgi:hypothetical protein
MEASAEALADPTAPETAESVGLININIYDSYLSNCSQVVRLATKTKDVTAALNARLHLSADDSKFFMLLVVVTLLDTVKKCYVNYLRTLHVSEEVQAVETNLVTKLTKRYKYSDEKDVRDTVRW